jgi:alpha-mannosidase
VPGAGIVDAARSGYRINLPERRLTGGGSVEPLVTVDDDGVIVESVKLADDRSGDVVVRLYEARGGKARATLRPGFAAVRAQTVDLLERPLGELPLTDAGVALALRPFQILTVRFTAGSAAG